MSENHVDIRHNIGHIQGIHYGHNYYSTNYYDGDRSQPTSRNITEQMHMSLKAVWKGRGTCEWLPQREEFKRWLNLENSCSILWIYGPPGCGKTILMSRVVESIRETKIASQELDAIHLLYFYVGYGDEKQMNQIYKNMLMTFWDQTHEDNQNPSDVFQHSSNEDVQKALADFFAKSKRDVYMVIDGLDQLPDEDQFDLLTKLNNIFQEHKQRKSKHKIATIISSRDRIAYEDLREHDAAQIQVGPADNSEDIKTFLTKKFSSRLFNRDLDLKQTVVSELMNKADGVFLWAQLQASNISDCSHRGSVLTALRNLTPPKKMTKVFEDYAAKFEELDTNTKSIERQITLRTMAILSQTTGSMPKEMFLVALSISSKDGKVDKELYGELSKDPDQIIRDCKHLIEINDNLGVFRFYHQSIFDFFRSYKPFISHGRIAHLCLTHLASSDFSHGPYSEAQWYDYKTLDPVLKKHPFLEFASCNWVASAKGCMKTPTGSSSEQKDVELLKCFEKLFGHQDTVSENNLQLSFQIYLLTLHKSMPTGVCYEHIISYFSLLEFFDSFEEKGWLDLKRCDSEGRTSIHWAIRNEAESDEKKRETARAVEKMISYGGDINAQDSEGRTPLYYAAHYGNQHILKLLLDKKADLDTRSNENETALIAACRRHHHHKEIVWKLLEVGADVRIESSVGTALQMVSMIGCDDCVEMILDQYGEQPIIEAEGPFGTALHSAALHGHANVVKLLCNRGFDIHATNESYGSVLTAAATGCRRGMDPTPFRQIYLELIERGVDVNDPSGLCGPALRATAFYGRIDLVRLLLENGANISLANGPMGTAYGAAHSEGYENVKELLLKKDPQAASYGEKSSNNANYTQLYRYLFKGALKASNMGFINSIIEQVEIFFEKELEKGNTPFFETMVDLGKQTFVDVIELALSENKKALKRTKLRKPMTKVTYEEEFKNGEEEIPIKVSRRNALKRLGKLLQSLFSSLLCVKLADNDPAPTLQPPSVNALVEKQFIHKTEGLINQATLKETLSRRQSASFGRDSLDGRFPEVLDRLTFAASRILEHAILNGIPEVINLIADTWIETLGTLVTKDGPGEPMLTRVMENRVIEFAMFFTDSSLTPEQRFKKGALRALVGIELLLSAAKKEKKYKYLAFILSKMWAGGAEAVEDLGEQGQAIIRHLLQIFIGNFSITIKKKDRVNAKIWGWSGLELTRATVLHPKRRFMIKLSGECARQCQALIETGMGDLAEELLEARLKDYRDCIKSKMFEEALGLALAAIELFRAAMEQGSVQALDTLLSILTQGFEWTIKTINNTSPSVEGPSSSTHKEDEGLDTGTIFDFAVRLFSTTEQNRPSLSHTRKLALLILDSIESVPDEDRKALVKSVHQRIEVAQKEAFTPELEMPLIQIALTIIYLLDVSRSSGGDDRPKTSLALKELTGPLSTIIKKGDFSRYKEALSFLESQENQDEIQTAVDVTGALFGGKNENDDPIS
ncbi:Putative ankyrin repeat-like protein [Cladobotryum mycophilum]|uniref:Ankyrin repeat-like protein n=1 Tax=Cladobotryum mycophilum TaxID=491253 RepID=A0ABR0SAL2_9HYPO